MLLPVIGPADREATVAAPPVMVPVAETEPVVCSCPACTVPVTDRLVRVPILVTAGCAAVDSVPDSVPPLTVGATTIPVADTLLTFSVSTMVRACNTPKDVMLGWLGVWITPLMRLAVSVPVVMVPVQLRVTTVPTEVMLGWLAAVTVAAATASGGTKFSKYWKFSSSSFRGIEPDCVPKV